VHSLKSLYLFLTLLVLLFNVNQLQAEHRHRTCKNVLGQFCKLPLGSRNLCYPGTNRLSRDRCTEGVQVPSPSPLPFCPGQTGINANGPAARWCAGHRFHRTCVNFFRTKACKIPVGLTNPCYTGTPGFSDRCTEGVLVPEPSLLQFCPGQIGINANGPAALWCR